MINLSQAEKIVEKIRGGSRERQKRGRCNILHCNIAAVHGAEKFQF